jgi:hypothetical protein
MPSEFHDFYDGCSVVFLINFSALLVDEIPCFYQFLEKIKILYGSSFGGVPET